MLGVDKGSIEVDVSEKDLSIKAEHNRNERLINKETFEGTLLTKKYYNKNLTIYAEF